MGVKCKVKTKNIGSSIPVFFEKNHKILSFEMTLYLDDFFIVFQLV